MSGKNTGGVSPSDHVRAGVSKLLLAGGLTSVPDRCEIMKYMGDAELTTIPLKDLSFIDTWDGVDVLTGFDSKAAAYLRENHNEEPNMCQPNMAPLSFNHMKSWAPSYLRNGMVTPVYVVRVRSGKHQRANYVIGGRHSCTLLSLAYGFDFCVPCIVYSVDTIHEAKMLSIILNNSRNTTTTESACTEIPHLMQVVGILEKGGVMRFASIILGINNSDNGNKHKEWQKKFLIALLTAPQHLGNPEIPITEFELMEQLGLDIPKFVKKLRRSGARGQGFTEKEMVSYVKNSTTLKSVRGSVEEIWEAYRTQLLNSFDLYNAYCMQIDTIKNDAQKCIDSRKVTSSVKEKCEAFLLHIDSVAYADGLARGIGSAVSFALYDRDISGPHAKQTRYKKDDTESLARLFSRVVARVVCDASVQARDKSNIWHAVFMDRVVNRKKTITPKVSERLNNMKMNIQDRRGKEVWERIKESLKNIEKGLPWDKDVVAIQRARKKPAVAITAKAKRAA